MKKQLFSLLFVFFLTNAGWAQKPYITLTSAIPISTEVGTTFKVSYTYTATSDVNVYCAINLNDDWDFKSFIGGEGRNVSAGRDVSGSFDLFIPKNTKVSSELKGKLNYKVRIEMKSVPDYIWIAGDYPATPLKLVSCR